MSSVGETLRRERLRKVLSLEQISRETKISARLLDAIENEQFDLLPGGVFAKSFVRQYARYLGLEEDELAAEVEKIVNPVVELPDPAAQPPEPVFHVPRVSEWQGARRNSSTLPALAMVVAVMLVCSVIYAWWQRSRRPAPSAPIAVVQKPETPRASAPPKPEAVQPTVASTSAPPPTLPSNPAAALHVQLSAGDDTWIQAWADGKSVMALLLKTNETRMVEAMEGVRVRTGNAAGLTVTVNGQPAGPIGPKGQVRDVEITRAGVQIRPLPPKPAPAPALEPL